MTIYTSDGKTYEDELNLQAGVEMPPEEERAPTKITVTKQKPAETEEPKVTGTDVWNSLKNDVSKFVDTAIGAITLGPKLMEKVYNGEIDPSSDEMIKHVSDVALTFGTGGVATAPLREGAGMFGGILGAAKSAERPNFYSLGKKDVIDDAIKATKEGMPADKILENYGVFEGPDNKWRFQFSDQGARLKTENLADDGLKKPWENLNGPDVQHYKTPYGSKNIPPIPDSVWKTMSFKDKMAYNGKRLTGPRLTVGDILHHPLLYKHYPDIANIKLDSGPLFDIFGSIKGWHLSDPAKESIFVRGDTEKSMLSTLLHEVQHAIQSREGHARGGNTEEFMPPEKDLFKTVKESASQLDNVLKQRWDESGIGEEVNKVLLPEWKKTYWSVRITHGDLQHALSQYHKGHELNPLQKKLVETVYDRDRTLLEDTMTKVEANHMVAKIEAEAFQKYKTLWGEYEARATQERMGMSDKELKANPFFKGKEFQETYPDSKIPQWAIKHPSLE